MAQPGKRPPVDPLDVWYTNAFPEPIVCWSCSHFLDEKCHRDVDRGVVCPDCTHTVSDDPLRKRNKCNGYAFPGRPPPRRRGDGWMNDRQDRTPLMNYYCLKDGVVMYVHVTGFGEDKERVHVMTNVRCHHCGSVHDA